MLTDAAPARAAGLPLWAVCAIAFTAILCLVLVALLMPQARARHRTRQARMDELRRYRLLGTYAGATATETDAPSESAFTVRALDVVDRAVRARGQRARIVDLLERSGVRMRPEEWAAIQLSAILACALMAAFVSGTILMLPVGGVLGWLICRIFISMKTKRRAAAFEALLPDSLQLLAGALRSGFALNQAIGAVVREGNEPVASELGRALREVQLGASLEDALDATAARMGSYDMTLVVMSIRTAREVGGNLAEVLDTTVHTMRERVQLRGTIKVLSAESRFSAKVLIALPLLLVAYLLAFRRAYIHPLYSTGVGIVLVIIGALLLLIGSFWLNRLTKIEV